MRKYPPFCTDIGPMSIQASTVRIGTFCAPMSLPASPLLGV
jgi:hypothetical protein